MSPRSRHLVRVATSAGLLLLIVWYVARAGPEGGLGRVVALLLSAAPTLVFAVLALLTVDRFLMAFKWLLLVRAQGLRMGFWEAVRAYYISSFAGIFLPMTVGADIVRVAAVRGLGSTPRVLATIALERGIGALSQLLWSLLSVVLIVALGLDLGVSNTGIAVVIGVLLILLGVILPFSFRLAEWAATALPKEGRLWPQVAELAGAYASWRHQRGVIGSFLVLTVIEGFFPIAWYFVGARALGLEIHFLLFVATIPIVFMLARLPVSLGGIGVLEGSFVVLGGVVGIPAEQAFSVVLLCQICLVLALLPGAIAYVVAGDTAAGPTP